MRTIFVPSCGNVGRGVGLVVVVVTEEEEFIRKEAVELELLRVTEVESRRKLVMAVLVSLRTGSDGDR